MITFAYPLIKSTSGWDEIKYSLRSVYKYYQGEWQPLIIGYKPPWYTGWHIPYYDNVGIPSEANKILVAASLVPEFVWMNDDIYFLKPTDLEFIKQPLVLGNMDNARRPQNLNKWRQHAWRTYDALKAKGYPGWNNSVHMPYYYESDLLIKTMQDFQYMPGKHLINLIYFNVNLGDKKPILFNGRRGYYAPPKIIRDLNVARYLNHSDAGLTDELKKLIINMFPERSRWENESRSELQDR